MLRTLDAAVAAGHGVNVSGRRLFVANRCCVWSVGYCMIQCSLRFQCQLFGCKINIVLLPGAYRSVQISVPFLRAFPDVTKILVGRLQQKMLTGGASFPAKGAFNLDLPLLSPLLRGLLPDTSSPPPSAELARMYFPQLVFSA